MFRSARCSIDFNLQNGAFKELLRLTRRDIDRMHGLFNRIDRDKSGCICYFEFLMHLSRTGSRS